MNHCPSPLARHDGFTLAELAVVLVIVALLIGGLLIPLSTQIDIRNVADTRRALTEIREAMLGYLVVNGRLPCPASATLVSGAVGAGLEGAWGREAEAFLPAAPISRELFRGRPWECRRPMPGDGATPTG
jgi:prepilin-type N-terminal cleavage/methylation domain